MNYLISPVIQLEDNDGKPLVGGKVYIYNHSTSTLSDTYSDFDGSLNTNPVLLDSLGTCTIIADEGYFYDIEVKDSNDELLFTRLNVTPAGGSNTEIINKETVVAAGNGISVTSTPVNGTMKYTVSLNTATNERFSTIETDIANVEEDIAELNADLYEHAVQINDITDRVEQTEKKLNYVNEINGDTFITDKIIWDTAYHKLYATDRYEIGYYTSGNSVIPQMKPLMNYEYFNIYCHPVSGMDTIAQFENNAPPVGYTTSFTSSLYSSMRKLDMSFIIQNGDKTFFDRYIAIKGQKSEKVDEYGHRYDLIHLLHNDKTYSTEV